MDVGRTWWRFGMAAGCIAVSSWFCLRSKMNSGIAEEHGLMENLQAACLLAGALAFWLEARKRTEATRYPLILAGLGYFTMMLLEFDVRPFGIPDLTRILNGSVRNAWLAAIWLFVLIKAAKQWRQILDQGLAWLRSVAGVLLCLAGLLWIVATVIEDVQSFLRDENHFPEELMETNAALLMLSAAVEITIMRQRKRNALMDSNPKPARIHSTTR